MSPVADMNVTVPLTILQEEEELFQNSVRRFGKLQAHMSKALLPAQSLYRVQVGRSPRGQVRRAKRDQ